MARAHWPPQLLSSSLRSYSTLLPQAPGRLPEVRLAGPCHGDLTPARISRSRPPCVIPDSRGLGRDGSIRRQGSWRNSLPRAAFGTGGTAGYRIWPSFIAEREFTAISHLLQVVLAHPPLSLFPFQGTLPGTCSGSDMEFSKSRPRGQRTTPSLFSPSS